MPYTITTYHVSKEQMDCVGAALLSAPRLYTPTGSRVYAYSSWDGYLVPAAVKDSPPVFHSDFDFVVDPAFTVELITILMSVAGASAITPEYKHAGDEGDKYDCAKGTIYITDGKRNVNLVVVDGYAEYAAWLYATTKLLELAANDKDRKLLLTKEARVVAFRIYCFEGLARFEHESAVSPQKLFGQVDIYVKQIAAADSGMKALIPARTP